MRSQKSFGPAERGAERAIIDVMAATQALTIVVIDSGVNTNHPHIFAPTRALALDAAKHPTAEDTVGHGTAVMAAIQDRAPFAEYIALKIFGDSLRASSSELLRALEWAIDAKATIVNLSLGTPNFEYREAMQAMVKRAEEASVILVAPRHAGPSVPVLPGSLEGVIGVEVDWDLPRDKFREADDVFYASGYPRSLPGVPPSRNLNGVSFAVANMTAFVAQVCRTIPVRRFAEVREALRLQCHLSS